MNDFSHVALDMSTLLNPNTVWLRLCNVVGRILIISADYVQKGNTTPDEWVFQLAMLAISTRLFMSSALPLIFAVFSVSTLSVRDRRIYSLLFESVGLSVLQFKTLLASETLEWIQFEPNASVELNGEYMYFLYSGEATTHVNFISKNEDTISTISHESNGNSNDAELGVGNRVFGDVQFAKALEPYGLYFFEEPCWPESVEGLANIKRSVKTPIATGERVTRLADFRDLFAAQACDVCQLDITHCGGLSEARRVAALAEAYRISLAPHNPQGPVSTAASLEFGFSQPSYIICETVHNDVPWRADIVQEGFTTERKGRIVRPNTKPGLGITIQETEVKKHPFQQELPQQVFYTDGSVGDW